MRVYYQQQPVSTLAEVASLARELDVPHEVTQIVVDSLSRGEAVNPQDFDEDKDHVIKLVSNLEVGDPVSVSRNRLTYDNSEVTIAEPIAEPDFSVRVMKDIVSESTDVLSEHFECDEYGNWSVNPANPPSVQDSYNAFATILKMGSASSMVLNYSEWVLANLIDTCERFHGEEFEPGQVARVTGKSAMYIRKFLLTYRWAKEKERIWKLPLMTICEIRQSELDEEDKMKVVEIAERHEFSQKYTRSLVKKAVEDGIDSVEGVEPDKLEDLLSKRSGERYYWILRDGFLTHEKHTRESLPYRGLCLPANGKKFVHNNAHKHFRRFKGKSTKGFAIYKDRVELEEAEEKTCDETEGTTPPPSVPVNPSDESQAT